MKAKHFAGLFAATFLLILSFSAAQAQKFNPNCRASHDQIGCTCALAAGGTSIDQGKKWLPPSSLDEKSSQVFAQCIKEWNAVAAQKIHPACQAANDPIPCTCALTSGGTSIEKGRKWYPPGSFNEKGNKAFASCLARNGQQR